MADVSPITQYRVTDHARFEMGRRGITESELAHVLSAPEQAEMVRPGRGLEPLYITSGRDRRIDSPFHTQ